MWEAANKGQQAQPQAQTQTQTTGTTTTTTEKDNNALLQQVVELLQGDKSNSEDEDEHPPKKRTKKEYNNFMRSRYSQVPQHILQPRNTFRKQWRTYNTQPPWYKRPWYPSYRTNSATYRDMPRSYNYKSTNYRTGYSPRAPYTYNNYRKTCRSGYQANPFRSAR